MWLSLEEVLKLPYGTKLERYESDWIYRMQQELVIIDESRGKWCKLSSN